MGAVNTTYTFTANDTITSTKMNDIIDQTTFTNDAVFDTTLAVASGKLKVNSQGITSNELAAQAVTQAKLGTNISSNGPAFRAYSSSVTYVPQLTFTKVTLEIESFDTNSNFASSRFTPSIAGYYLISGCVAFGTGTTIYVLSAIAKNGSVSDPQTLGSGQTEGPALRSNVSDIIYFNGSTDYVELCAFHGASGGSYTSGNTQTYFSGCLIRSA